MLPPFDPTGGHVAANRSIPDPLPPPAPRAYSNNSKRSNAASSQCIAYSTRSGNPATFASPAKRADSRIRKIDISSPREVSASSPGRITLKSPRKIIHLGRGPSVNHNMSSTNSIRYTGAARFWKPKDENKRAGIRGWMKKGSKPNDLKIPRAATQMEASRCTPTTGLRSASTPGPIATTPATTPGRRHYAKTPVTARHQDPVPTNPFPPNYQYNNVPREVEPVLSPEASDSLQSRIDSNGRTVKEKRVSTREIYNNLEAERSQLAKIRNSQVDSYFPKVTRNASVASSDKPLPDLPAKRPTNNTFSFEGPILIEIGDEAQATPGTAQTTTSSHWDDLQELHDTVTSPKGDLAVDVSQHAVVDPTQNITVTGEVNIVTTTIDVPIKAKEPVTTAPETGIVITLNGMIGSPEFNEHTVAPKSVGERSYIPYSPAVMTFDIDKGMEPPVSPMTPMLPRESVEESRKSADEPRVSAEESRVSAEEPRVTFERPHLPKEECQESTEDPNAILLNDLTDRPISSIMQVPIISQMKSQNRNSFNSLSNSIESMLSKVPSSESSDSIRSADSPETSPTVPQKDFPRLGPHDFNGGGGSVLPCPEVHRVEMSENKTKELPLPNVTVAIQPPTPDPKTLTVDQITEGTHNIGPKRDVEFQDGVRKSSIWIDTEHVNDSPSGASSPVESTPSSTTIAAARGSKPSTRSPSPASSMAKPSSRNASPDTRGHSPIRVTMYGLSSEYLAQIQTTQRGSVDSSNDSVATTSGASPVHPPASSPTTTVEDTPTLSCPQTPSSLHSVDSEESAVHIVSETKPPVLVLPDFLQTGETSGPGSSSYFDLDFSLDTIALQTSPSIRSALQETNGNIVGDTLGRKSSLDPGLSLPPTTPSTLEIPVTASYGPISSTSAGPATPSSRELPSLITTVPASPVPSLPSIITTRSGRTLITVAPKPKALTPETEVPLSTPLPLTLGSRSERKTTQPKAQPGPYLPYPGSNQTSTKKNATRAPSPAKNQKVPSNLPYPEARAKSRSRSPPKKEVPSSNAEPQTIQAQPSASVSTPNPTPMIATKKPPTGPSPSTSKTLKAEPLNNDERIRARRMSRRQKNHSDITNYMYRAARDSSDLSDRNWDLDLYGSSPVDGVGEVGPLESVERQRQRERTEWLHVPGSAEREAEWRAVEDQRRALGSSGGGMF
ncbi:hypothetical protein MMC09_005019 [Bachmanniomyces sp. S44760]|nr:hypothetical protein [Bachmanniomyces sp. S44760]